MLFAYGIGNRFLIRIIAHKNKKEKQTEGVFCKMEKRTEKVLCFGEGNFLRAFCAVAVQRMNENAGFGGSIVMLQGLETGRAAAINAQGGKYTVVERGFEGGKPVERFVHIDCISRCVDPYADYAEFLKIAENPSLELIVSNTTEFGIAFDGSETSGKAMYKNYPAKLTDFLFHRWKHFGAGAGLAVLPCELIESNGKKLKECVLKYAELWNLGEDFVRWLEGNVTFADTLVDRIVSGYPKAEAGEICARLGYTDTLLDVCEPFFLWVIEADAEKLARIPLQKSGLEIVVTRDLRPYRTRKVRILNGAHTMSVLLGHLAGYVTVEQMLGDDVFCRYLEKGIAEEIIPSFEGEGLSAYAASVFERFRNPFLNHKLLDISLNSVSKWKTRVLCSVKDDISRTGNCPPLLCFSLAGLIAFYKQGANSFVRDDAAAVQFIAENSVAAIVQNAALWGEDLSLLHPALCPLVEKGVALIAEKGPRAAVEAVCNGTI